VYILYKFFGIPFRSGGDYYHFARECENFFLKLTNCHVDPIVIFDGADDPSNLKLKTHMKRLDQQSENVQNIVQQIIRGVSDDNESYDDEPYDDDPFILPLLADLNFRSVLVKLGISHASCLFEADREIAFLANKFGCPVLSADSDFYVFKLKVGCIHPDDLLPALQQSTDNLPTKIYNCQVLMNKFKMKADDFILPVFATLVGNDYVDFSSNAFKSPRDETDMLSMFAVKSQCDRKRSIVQFTINWLCRARFSNGDEAFTNLKGQLSDEAKNTFENSVMSYCNVNCKSEKGAGADVSEEVLNTIFSRSTFAGDLPKHFIRDVIKCDINSKFLLNIAINKRFVFKGQIEDRRNPPSFASSRGIRRVIYEILVGQSPKKERNIKEYHRVKHNVSNVNPLTSLPDFPTLPHIAEIETLDTPTRKSLLFAVFGDMVEILPEELDETSRIIILMLSLWKRNSKASVDQLKAFVISIFTMQICTADDPNEIEILSVRGATEIGTFVKFRTDMRQHLIERMDLNKNDIDFLHKNAQFQAIYKEMQFLNQLLLKPVFLPDPERFLQSTLVRNVFLFMTMDKNPLESFFCGQTSLLFLFGYWLELITRLCKLCVRDRCPVASTKVVRKVSKSNRFVQIYVSINNAA
jgi:hypothetical protein